MNVILWVKFSSLCLEKKVESQIFRNINGLKWESISSLSLTSQHYNSIELECFEILKFACEKPNLGTLENLPDIVSEIGRREMHEIPLEKFQQLLYRNAYWFKHIKISLRNN